MVRFNRAATEMLGLAPTDVARRPGAIDALRGIAELEALCTSVIADQTPARREVRLGDRHVLLRAAPYRESTDQTSNVVLTFTNVTAFRASLEQAVYEREYTKAILNSVTSPLVVLDADLRVQSANRAFYTLFGVSRDRTQGVPLRALDGGDDAWKASALWASLEQMLQDDRPFQPLEITRDFLGVGRRTLLADGRRLALLGDAPTILLAFQDVTAHKRAAEELRDADRRKDEFLALLSHELRNPLAPIRMGLELIRVSGDTPQSVERVRGMMERQLSQMKRLIDDLIDVSRITSGKIVLQRAHTALRELMERAIEAQRAAIDAALIDLTLELPPPSCVVDVDPARFVQILTNVLHNATKFTSPQGTIRVSTKTLDDARPPQVAIAVSDTGVGIAPELLPRVFDLFVQAESPTARTHGGLGIGLALARRLVEMHGGEIAAFSDGPGLGSTFVITMPLTTASAARDALLPSDVVRVASRVVVIDDNVDAAATLAMLIEQLGGTVRVAHDGESGLEAVSAFQPDIVLLDIGMPRMDGYAVCRRIREQRSPRPMILIAVTGWGQTQDKRRALDAGFDAHLTKPVDPAVLERVLAGWAPSDPR